MSQYNLSLFRKDAFVLESIRTLDNWKKYPKAKRHLMAERVAISQVQVYKDKKATGDTHLCRRIYYSLLNAVECPQDYGWTDDQVVAVCGAIPLQVQAKIKPQHEPGYIMALGRRRIAFALGQTEAAIFN